MATGSARGRLRTMTVATRDDRVAQDGGHTPANRLTETCTLVYSVLL